MLRLVLFTVAMSAALASADNITASVEFANANWYVCVPRQILR